MSTTTDRLNEVVHMYNQMKNIPIDKPGLFRTNLNSFVTLARSVTNVMQKEFKDVPGFAEWYATKQEEMRKDEDMKLFIELRNESLKEKSVGEIFYKVTLLQDVTLKPGEDLSGPTLKQNDDGTLRVDENNKYLTIKGVPQPDIKYEYSVNYRFKQRPGIDAKSLCLAHYKKLEKLVTECNEKFLGRT